MMKHEIVILSRSLPFHGLGGMEIVAWDLAREFARRGQTVRIITTPMPGREGEFEQDGVRVVPLQGVPGGRYSSAWWAASRRYFERHCMDTTRAVLSVSAAAFGLLSLKPRMKGTAFVMQAHGTSWGEVISKWRSRRLKSILGSARNLLWLPRDLMAYPRFDAVVAVGERVNQDLLKPPASWVLPAARVCLINNGIDTSVFHPSNENRKAIREELGLDDQTPLIVSASRLHVQKGVGHALRAFALLLDEMPDAVYLVAGDGPERASLESLSADLGIAGRVRFLGALDRPRLAGILQAADAFVFLTEHVEGLPLNILEALACGLQCIISNHLKIFESDFLLPAMPRDAREVAQILGSTLNSRDAWTESQLPPEFVLAHSARQYLELFSDIA